MRHWNRLPRGAVDPWRPQWVAWAIVWQKGICWVGMLRLSFDAWFPRWKAYLVPVGWSCGTQFLNHLKDPKNLIRDTYFIDHTVVRQFSVLHLIPLSICLSCRQGVFVNPFQFSKYKNSWVEGKKNGSAQEFNSSAHWWASLFAWESLNGFQHAGSCIRN